MNNKFLDKVVDQIISETRINNDEVYTPFSSLPFFPSPFFFSSILSPSIFSHCKKVYSLNEQEIEYVWKEYKEGLTALMDKKELSYE